MTPPSLPPHTQTHTRTFPPTCHSPHGRTNKIHYHLAKMLTGVKTKFIASAPEPPNPAGCDIKVSTCAIPTKGEPNLRKPNLGAQPPAGSSIETTKSTKKRISRSNSLNAKTRKNPNSKTQKSAFVRYGRCPRRFHIFMFLDFL